MSEEKRYYAFISYKHEDKKEAKRLQHQLEYYRLPNQLRKVNPDLPKYVRPIFRDMTDLEVGDPLSTLIHEALEQSNYLIVVCSPRSAKSEWVNDEVKYFISLGRQDKIIPYIIEGVPHADDPSEECYPPALLQLSKENELLGANINEVGKEAAGIRVVAKMFGIQYDTLYQRYKRERKRKLWAIFLGIVLFIIVGVSVGLVIFHQNTDIKEKRIREIANTSLLLSESGNSYLARCIIARQEITPHKQYPPMLEYAFRVASQHNDAIMKGHSESVNTAFFCPDGRLIVSASDDKIIRIWNSQTGHLVRELVGHTAPISSAVFSHNCEQIVSASLDNSLIIWDVEKGDILKSITLDERSGYIRFAIFSSNDKRIYFALSDEYGFGGSFGWWDIETDDALIYNSEDFPSNYIDVSPDNKRIALPVFGMVLVWDVQKMKILHVLDAHVRTTINSAKFSPDGRLIVSAYKDNTIRVWDIENEQQVLPVLRGHKNSVCSASFSPDGKYIVSASEDNTIRIWDFETGNVVNVLEGHDGPVHSVSFSPNGKQIVSASEDKTIRLWDVENNKALHTLQGCAPDDGIFSFSPNGMRAASTTRASFGHQENALIIWDVETGDILQKIEKQEGFLSVNFSHDGKLIVAALLDSTIRVWDVQTQEEIFNVKENTLDINYSAIISPNNEYILSINDKTISIWDLNTKHKLNNIEGHESVVVSVAFNSTGNLIVSGSCDRTVRVWDVQTGQELHRFQMPNIATTVSFSPDNNMVVATTGSEIIAWDVNTEESLWKIKGYQTGFSPDGKLMVSVLNNGSIKICDVETGKIINHLDTTWILDKHNEPSDVIEKISFSMDGMRIMAVSSDNYTMVWDVSSGEILKKGDGHTGPVLSACYSPDGTQIISASDEMIIVWDTRKESVMKRLDEHYGQINAVTFSNNGKFFASASSDGTILIWDAFADTVLYTLEGHEKEVVSVSISPNDEYIASASIDSTIIIWNYRGEYIRKLEGHKGHVFSVCFNPSDPRYIVSASSDSTIKIWDVESGTVLLPLQGHNGMALSAIYSPDGKYIVSTSEDNTIIVWDNKTGDLVKVLSEQANNVSSVSYSPDGKYLVYCSEEMIIVRETQTWEIVQKIVEHNGVNVVLFSPDGRYIVSGSEDQSLRIYNFPSLQELIDSTRDRFKDRLFTPEERRKYYLE